MAPMTKFNPRHGNWEQHSQGATTIVCSVFVPKMI